MDLSKTSCLHRLGTSVIVSVSLVVLPQTTALADAGTTGAISGMQSTTSNTVGTLPSAVVGNPAGTMFQIFAWLIVIVLLAVVFIRFLGRKMQVQQKGSIEILAAKQIAPNRSVQVIEVQGKRFLIGVGEQISLLADITEDVTDDFFEEAAAKESSFGPVFSQALQSVRNRYNADAEEQG